MAIIQKIKERVPAADLAALVLFLSLIIILSGFFHRLDNWTADFWFNLRIDQQAGSSNRSLDFLLPKTMPSDEIVLVVIDDTSILGIPGLFKGDRAVFARALNNLSSAKAIGLDVFFPEPNLENPEADEALIESVTDLKKVILKAYRRDNRRMTPPFPRLAKNTTFAPSYFTNSGDDAIRKVSLFFESESDELVPSFQLEILKKFWNLPDDAVKITDGRIFVQGQEKNYLIELTDEEYMQINYDRSVFSYKVYSFYDIYENLIDSDLIKDKIVLIGFANSMTDEKYFTPIAGKVFSPYLHAFVLSNLLNQNGLRVTSKITNISIAAVIFIVFHLMVFPFLSPPIIAAVSALSLAASMALSMLMLNFYQYQIGMSSTIFLIFASMLYVIGRKYYVEYSEKMRIRNAFQHYVTPSVVNEILKNPEKLNLHGEERNLTIFFSDIEGFTSLSEGMSPLDVVSLLNEYLSEMTEIIFKYEGLLDKYEGDAIMAVFGAPVDQADHAIRSCRCAIQNQIALTKLREKWKNEGKPQFRARIGINTGIVVVGNMGSKMRFDYTVIGDNVNLAARLETANKIMNTEILVSETTARLAEAEIVSRCLGKLKVAGKTQHVNVYEVLADVKLSTPDCLEKARTLKDSYENGYAAFVKNDFNEARQILETHLKKFPRDCPAISLLEKSKAFQIVPPPPDWEYIITQENK